MTPKENLKELLLDIFLLDESEFNFELKRDDIETWDSLAVVSIAVGIHETFGYHFTPEEATSIASVQEIIKLLESKDIPFSE
jgi:acyl carrier protein